MPLPLLPLFLLLSVLCLPAPAAPMDVTALSPAAGAPGQRISLSGGPFPESTEIVLGDRILPPETRTEGVVTFMVPSLPEGDYALRVRADGELGAPAFTFRVVPPTPRLRTLAPATVNSCSLLQGQPVALSGDFPPQSQVLLDGAIVPVERLQDSEIVFLVPLLPTGMHQVMVASPGDRRSLPHALFVNGVPRIEAVDQGMDYVTSYEVVIRGENFLFDSLLVVNGVPLSQAVEGDVEQNYTALHRLGGEDYVRYQDCQTLVYIRHPVTRVPKTVTLQVVNPGGEQSPVYVVAIP